MTSNTLPAIHPGEILREEYLAPLNMSAGQLAKELYVPRTRVERLIAETTALSFDTALRLAKFFGTTPQYWLNMQMSFDLKTFADDREKQKELAAIHQLEAAE